MIGNATEAARVDLPARQLRLVTHQELIRGCTRCVKAGYIPSAWPVFHGTAGCRVMVVGQAPAIRRAERPLPYSGATGRTLRSWLDRAGFPEDYLHQHCYLTSLTKCFPGPSTSGKGDRSPSAAEISCCRPHLQGELALVQPDVVLTLGRLAATYFVGSRPLDQLVGQVHEAGGRRIIPLPHPSGVSRWLNQPDNQSLLHQALALLAELRVKLELEPLGQPSNSDLRPPVQSQQPPRPAQ